LKITSSPRMVSPANPTALATNCMAVATWSLNPPDERAASVNCPARAVT